MRLRPERNLHFEAQRHDGRTGTVIPIFLGLAHFAISLKSSKYIEGSHQHDSTAENCLKYIRKLCTHEQKWHLAARAM